MLKNRHCPCHIIANDHAEAIPQRVSQKKRIEPFHILQFPIRHGKNSHRFGMYLQIAMILLYNITIQFLATRAIMPSNAGSSRVLLLLNDTLCLLSSVIKS